MSRGADSDSDHLLWNSINLPPDLHFATQLIFVRTLETGNIEKRFCDRILGAIVYCTLKAGRGELLQQTWICECGKLLSCCQSTIHLPVNCIV